MLSGSELKELRLSLPHNAERYTIPQLVFQHMCGYPIYSTYPFEQLEKEAYEKDWRCQRCGCIWKPISIIRPITFNWTFYDETIGRMDKMYAMAHCPNCGSPSEMRGMVYSEPIYWKEMNI